MSALGKLRAVTRTRWARIQWAWCPICERRVFLFPVESIELARNDYRCVKCKSTSRNRHLFFCLRRYAAITKSKLKIWITSSTGSIAEKLRHQPGVVLTEYYDGVLPGDYKNKIRCESLTGSSFADQSLDCVLSEDVFEHIPDIAAAMKELYRILKPGGMHLFTVPLDLSRKSECLFEVVEKAEGKVNADRFVLKQPIEWHGDPVRGAIPAYWRFGWDLAGMLENEGFVPAFVVPTYAETSKFGLANCITVIARKP